MTAPDFPELTTFGEGRDDALQHALDAIEEAIAARIADGDPLPPPMAEAKGKRHAEWVKLPAMIALKAMLYVTLHESGVTRAEFARRLDWHREQVDRLFRLDHASRLEQLEAAFKALHKDVDIHVKESA